MYDKNSKIFSFYHFYIQHSNLFSASLKQVSSKHTILYPTFFQSHICVLHSSNTLLLVLTLSILSATPSFKKNNFKTLHYVYWDFLSPQAFYILWKGLRAEDNLSFSPGAWGFYTLSPQFRADFVDPISKSQAKNSGSSEYGIQVDLAMHFWLLFQ